MASYDLNTAKQKVTDYTTSKYGRGPQNDQEWGQIAGGINYNDGVDDNELNQAYGNADSLARSLGSSNAPAPSPQPAPQATGAVPPAPGVNPYQQQVQESLTGLITRGQQAPSLSDPTLQPQADVFRATQQRSAERQRAALAERMAAQGMAGSGGFDVGVGQIEAQRGLNEANFNAALVGNEVGARRGDTNFALNLLSQLGDSSALRSLNQQLGLGDLGLRRDALTQQGQLGRGALGMDLMRALLANDHFYSGQGVDLAKFQALLNQSAVNSLFGGF